MIGGEREREKKLEERRREREREIQEVGSEGCFPVSNFSARYKFTPAEPQVPRDGRALNILQLGRSKSLKISSRGRASAQ